MSDYLERTNNGTQFEGGDVNIFGMLVIATALRSYAKTGMKMNANYTPTNMLAAATKYTGKKFKRGQYIEAADALTEYANQLKNKPREEG